MLVKQGFSPIEQYEAINLKQDLQRDWTDVYAVGATLYYCLTGVRPEESRIRKAALDEKRADIKEPMPNLNMKNQALAEQLLAYMGIQPTITEEYSDLIKQGKVLAQSVEVGSVIEPGAAVELAVSQGSKPFQMPNVTGMTEDAAKRGTV